MLDYSWSRLIGTPIWQMSEIMYRSRPLLSYHNWTHIGRGYQHAKTTFEFEYDVNVDLAWLGHDIIYDELPEKEYRSIGRIRELYNQYGPIPGVAMDVVEEMIATTINHNSTDDDRVIMMDMADLADPEQTVLNYELICEESRRLYHIDRATFCQNSSNFMTGLRGRVEQNAQKTGLPFWLNVLQGVDTTLQLSRDDLTPNQ